MIVFLALAGCSVALPVRPPNDLGLLVGVPVLIEDPTVSQKKQQDGSTPMVYGLLLSKLVETDDNVDGGPIEKRSVDEDAAADDLETAAGTYALRPLFVYRQQLAYRERVREAIRRGNRF